jgi:uridylate kinase
MSLIAAMIPYKKLMLKLSGEALKNWSDELFDYDFMRTLADKIKTLIHNGHQIAIVLWAGNIYRWARQEDIDRVQGDYVGMLATVINATVFAQVLEQQGVKTKVFSSLSVPKMTDDFSPKKANQALADGYVIFCAWGTWHPFFSTDTAAAQKALELGCDVVVKATKVDGVYDKDPIKHTDAVKFATISLQEAQSRGLQVMDQTAFAIALENKLPMIVCKMEDIEKIGTDDLSHSYIYA